MRCFGDVLADPYVDDDVMALELPSKNIGDFVDKQRVPHVYIRDQLNKTIANIKEAKKLS